MSGRWRSSRSCRSSSLAAARSTTPEPAARMTLGRRLSTYQASSSTRSRLRADSSSGMQNLQLGIAPKRVAVPPQNRSTALRFSEVRLAELRLVLGAEEPQDGEDAAMVLGRRGQPELGEDAGHVLLHRPRRDEEPLADRLVRAALRHELENLALAGRKLLDRVISTAAADALGDHQRVERGPALGHAPDGLRELVDLRDPILEQVAEPLGAVRQQLDRIRVRDVLGEHEHTRLGVLRADL